MTAPRLESPLPEADCLRFFWPTLPPMSVASTTKAIQPMTAVLRCAALHLPARAAKFLGCKSLSPVELMSTAGTVPAATPLCRAGSRCLERAVLAGWASAGSQSAGGGRTPAVSGLHRHARGTAEGSAISRRARRQLELPRWRAAWRGLRLGARGAHDRAGVRGASSDRGAAAGGHRLGAGRHSRGRPSVAGDPMELRGRTDLRLVA